MRKGLVVVAFSLIPLPALAALPPHFQRQAELVAILNHVTEEFGISRPIESIVMKGVDFYDVRSGSCHMEVVIVSLPPEPGKAPVVGPRQFAVESGPLVCD